MDILRGLLLERERERERSPTRIQRYLSYTGSLLKLPRDGLAVVVENGYVILQLTFPTKKPWQWKEENPPQKKKSSIFLSSV